MLPRFQSPRNSVQAHLSLIGPEPAFRSLKLSPRGPLEGQTPTNATWLGEHCKVFSRILFMTFILTGSSYFTHGLPMQRLESDLNQFFLNGRGSFNDQAATLRRGQSVRLPRQTS